MFLTNTNIVTDALLGVAVGDALGVPAEFVSRELRDERPVVDMRAYGTHNQPAGTWSDDTSLTLCLADMLCGSFSLEALAGNFINWQQHGLFTARGHVFDIGIATSQAIHRLRTGTPPTLAGGADEYSNGNGSLMRILPLVFYTRQMTIEERFRYTRNVSSLTHRHIRSVIACFIYLEYARLLLDGVEKHAALHQLQDSLPAFLITCEGVTEEELNRFHRILALRVGRYDPSPPLAQLPRGEIYSDGYVLHTLEASLWCLLNTATYAEAVLTAVNMGSDTDTTAAVTGGLAGILYGANSIPPEWLAVLARRSYIEELAGRMYTAVSKL